MDCARLFCAAVLQELCICGVMLQLQASLRPTGSECGPRESIKRMRGRASAWLLLSMHGGLSRAPAWNVQVNLRGDIKLRHKRFCWLCKAMRGIAWHTMRGGQLKPIGPVVTRGLEKRCWLLCSKQPEARNQRPAGAPRPAHRRMR